MESGEDFKILSYDEFNSLPDICSLSGEIPRSLARLVTLKLDVLELSADDRKKVLASIWDYYPLISEKHLREEHCGRLPESMIHEIMHEKMPSDPSNPKYDYLIYLHTPNYYGVRNDYILQKLRKHSPAITSITGSEEELLKCPCCGYRTLDQRGMYFICEVCFWEDDGVDHDEDLSGPNHMTLGEGRANFKKYGACDARSINSVDPEGKLKYTQ